METLSQTIVATIFMVWAMLILLNSNYQDRKSVRYFDYAMATIFVAVSLSVQRGLLF